MEQWENRDKEADNVIESSYRKQKSKADIESRDEEAQVLIVCYTGRCLRAVSLKVGGAATWGVVDEPSHRPHL
jgi:hypothetical protein